MCGPLRHRIITEARQPLIRDARVAVLLRVITND
jgi:hypothetical protein